MYEVKSPKINPKYGEHVSKTACTAVINTGVIYVHGNVKKKKMFTIERCTHNNFFCLKVAMISFSFFKGFFLHRLEHFFASL